MPPMETNNLSTRNELLTFLWVCFLSLAGGAALVAVRFLLTDRFFYYFLLWNLVLAFIPYGISVAFLWISRRPAQRSRGIILFLLGLSWLIFYPNAPYIFTDFIHLINRTFVRSGTEIMAKETLLWFDLVLCSAFAYLGHTAGLFSINLMLRSFSGLVRPALARSLVGLAILISGFGIYVGRFVRFNSWDLFVHPLRTLKIILPYLSSPRAILISVSFSAFILLTYAALHLSRKRFT